MHAQPTFLAHGDRRQRRRGRWTGALTVTTVVVFSFALMGATTPRAAPEADAHATVRVLTGKHPLAPDATASEVVALDARMRTSHALVAFPSRVDDEVWDRLAACESDGRWDADTGNGYYGGLQFALSSWHWVGGRGHPHEFPREVQVAKAERLLEWQGWHAWPACSRMLGLR